MKMIGAGHRDNQLEIIGLTKQTKSKKESSGKCGTDDLYSDFRKDKERPQQERNRRKSKET